MAKINAAYAWGGTPLMVQTVETFTGVHLDHVLLIDFAGFAQVVNALGGVDLKIEKTITSIHPPHRTFRKGTQHLSGAEALDYVRQRYQFADGDFSMPMAIHDRVPPGAETMQRLVAKISYTYEQTDLGGRVRIRTSDPAALDAVHAFLRFQIEDHRTGDPLEVSEER